MADHVLEPATPFQAEIRESMDFALRQDPPGNPWLQAEHISISSGDIHFLFFELYKLPNRTARVVFSSCDWLPGSVAALRDWIVLTHGTQQPRPFALVDDLDMSFYGSGVHSPTPNDLNSIVAQAQNLRYLSLGLDREFTFLQLSRLVNSCCMELETLRITVGEFGENDDDEEVEFNFGRLQLFREFELTEFGSLTNEQFGLIMDGLRAATNLTSFQLDTGDTIKGRLPLLANLVSGLGEGRNFSLVLHSDGTEVGVLSDPVEVGILADAVAQSKGGLACLEIGRSASFFENAMFCPARNLSILLQNILQSSSLETFRLRLESPAANKDVLLESLPFIKHLKALSIQLFKSSINLSDTECQSQIIDALKSSCSLEDIHLEVGLADEDPVQLSCSRNSDHFNPALRAICDRNKHVANMQEKLDILLPSGNQDQDGEHDISNGQDGLHLDNEEELYIQPPDGLWPLVIHKVFNHYSGGTDAARMAVCQYFECCPAVGAASTGGNKTGRAMK